MVIRSLVISKIIMKLYYALLVLLNRSPSIVVTAFHPSSSSSSSLSPRRWGNQAIMRSTRGLILNARPEPLATEGEWTAYLDEETTGLIYYFNGETGESLWEPPSESFPVVVLPRQMRRQAESKRSEYIKSLQDKEAKRDFPELNSARNKEEAERKLQEQQQQGASEGGWFDFLFEEEPQSEPEPEPNWFESVSSVFSGTDTNGDASTTTTKQPPDIKEDRRKDGDEGDDEKKPGLFERFVTVGTNGAGPDTLSKKPSGPDAAVEDEVARKPGLFERMMTPVVSGGTEVDTGVAVEKKVLTRPQPTIEPLVTPEPEVLAPIKIEAASCVLPHPAKMLWGGEDAVFTAGRTFGVFDGVTGANKLDGVPLYSKTLASEMRKASKMNSADTMGMSVQELQRCLNDAREVADSSSTGASTAIVASITEDGFLRSLNLGDSVCIVIRRGKMAARTREISHYFDCPYQLSTESPDKPRDGTKLNVELVRGDTIVMGSDGVFDNLVETEIVEMVTTILQDRPNAKPSMLAKKIADQSRKVSLSSKAATPYAKQAKRNGDPDFNDGVGGKVDDVGCVVVRYV